MAKIEIIKSRVTGYPDDEIKYFLFENRRNRTPQIYGGNLKEIMEVAKTILKEEGCNE